MWNPSRPADFPVDNLVPQAVLMLGVHSAEAKKSVARIVPSMERARGLFRHATSQPSQIGRTYRLMEPADAFRERGRLMGHRSNDQVHAAGLGQAQWGPFSTNHARLFGTNLISPIDVYGAASRSRSSVAMNVMTSPSAARNLNRVGDVSMTS